MKDALALLTFLGALVAGFLLVVFVQVWFGVVASWAAALITGPLLGDGVGRIVCWLQRRDVSP